MTRLRMGRRVTGPEGREVVTNLQRFTTDRCFLLQNYGNPFMGTQDEPQLGDRSITNVDLFDKHHTKVGTGTGVCTVVSIPPLDTRVQCLLSATFDDEGQIIFGGLAPLPEVGGVVQFGILGGTEKFRKARGVVTLAVLTPELTQEATFELE